MISKISDLQEREIINIADGKCLGSIKDIDIDLDRGCIQGLVLPGIPSFWSLFQNRGELIIPWENVVRIGVDVILVNIDTNQLFDGRAVESSRWQEELKEYERDIEYEREIEYNELS